MTGNRFHRGEREAQQRYGVHERMAQRADRLMRPEMPEQHQRFYQLLPYVFVGSLDQKQRPWASIMTGEPGFTVSPDPTSLEVRAAPIPGDPLSDHLIPHAPIGILGIDFHTRRRNRVNGRVNQRLGEGGFRLDVDQAFGNCPKFIQARTSEWKTVPNQPRVTQHERHLTAEMLAILAKADTFFIASHHGHGPDTESDASAKGVDVSHRGGQPGFVVPDGDRGFRFPDYRGNFFFNTIGNLVMNARSGYLFPDFESGSVLSMTGRSEIRWDPVEIPFPSGAERVIEFRVEEAFLIESALPFDWSFLSYSPFLFTEGT